MSPKRTHGAGGPFRAIAEYTYDWESWIGPHGRVEWVNAAVERMTGYTVAECLRMRRYPLPIVHPEDRRRVGAALRKAGARRSGNDLPFRVLHRGGSERWGAMSWQSIYDESGAWLGYRTSVRDITARQQAEEVLRQAKREAERASAIKSEFLATVSHELRSPLQSILGYTQLLERSHLDAEQARHAANLRLQGEVLLKLVEDLLDLSAMQAAKLRLEQARFDVVGAVERAVDALRPLAAQKELELTCRVDDDARLSVLGDGRRLGQILLNLIGNAVKFTERGRVNVRVRCGRGRRTVLAFAVSDTGVGISRRVRANLFAPFAQGDSSLARRHGGTGLGLAISARLAELMGGTIAVRARRSGGSIFTLTLPVAGARPIRGRGQAAKAKPSPERPFLQTSWRKILVVDDDVAAREVALALLRSLGVEADVAGNAREALRALERREYDLVLMDVHLPKVDGLATTRLIRERHGRRPRIVALTANVLAENRQACTAAGMDGFLTKPVRLEELHRMVETSATAKSTERRSGGTLDPVLVAELRSQVDGQGRSLLARVAEAAARTIPSLLVRARRACGREDAGAVAQAAHGVLGHARLVGARETVDAAAALESAARAGNVAKCRALLSVVRASARSLLAELRAASATPLPSPGEVRHTA